MLIFSENDVEHTHLSQHFWLYLDIFIFSLIKFLSCNKTLKVLGLYVLCINRMSLHKKVTQNVQKIIDCFVV